MIFFITLTPVKQTNRPKCATVVQGFLQFWNSPPSDIQVGSNYNSVYVNAHRVCILDNSITNQSNLTIVIILVSVSWPPNARFTAVSNPTDPNQPSQLTKTKVRHFLPVVKKDTTLRDGRAGQLRVNCTLRVVNLRKTKYLLFYEKTLVQMIQILIYSLPG